MPSYEYANVFPPAPPATHIAPFHATAYPFIEKMLLNDTSLDRKIITDECFEMLVNKKISKKTIEFDGNNDISILGKYSIVVSV